MKHHLLDVPAEVLTQILYEVLPPFIFKSTTIRWMFIRTDFQIRYLPVTPLPRGSASVVLVCSKFKDIIVQMLYGLPRWRCDCRLERLRMQIGATNFAAIRRMIVSADDLVLISQSAELEAQPASSRIPHVMKFTSLEELCCEGYEWDVLLKLIENDVEENVNELVWLRSNMTRYMMQNAATLCRAAATILYFHPKLNVLAQKKQISSDTPGTMRGGSDAIDPTAGRVQWRFVKNKNRQRETEEVVRPDQLRALFEDIRRYDATLVDSRGWPAGLGDK